MESFPVNIELLSRFRSPGEIKESLRKIKAGTADLIIGTHRLIQDDVNFKQLGLVIIDEEQRFGVAHKEKFKSLFAGVDVLTLSATPIPRTLNMAMSGIRDMSVIETPPHDRRPVTSYVTEYDPGVIEQAITKELRRNGQVYYVHNRIESITECAGKIRSICPEANIGIAHGKMSEDDLLEVWRKLLEREIDVLVCTTIIETGVDVPNVNTLIIENADNMGLAQLHQLRGRVGRTNKRAFAYFTFKRGKMLTEIAEKRLKAIREFTQFGAGFRIAMRDLEIRGAGSVLGESQSGHLSAVGYEMYVSLLNEAVAEKKAKKLDVSGAIRSISAKECTVDVKVNAFIPENYISDQSGRITCYKRIAEIRDEDDSYDVIDELIDRYGEIPESVMGLVEIAGIRNIAGELGFDEIVQEGRIISMYTKNPDMKRLSSAGGSVKGVALKLTGRTGITIKLDKSEKPLEVLKTFLQNYKNAEVK
jgi:transcription-repair coupling factor (superfamily II helicase)